MFTELIVGLGSDAQYKILCTYIMYEEYVLYIIHTEPMYVCVRALLHALYKRHECIGYNRLLN